MGEATNPGPSNFESEQLLTLGTFNPSGLAGKALSCLEVGAGVWGVAETQSTQSGFTQFQRDLHFQARSQNRRLRAVHGGFAPLRPGSQQAGAWTGVAFLSDITVRPFDLPWRSLEFSSGRTLCCAFHFGQHHLLGATVYLPPSGPTYGNTTSVASSLLEVLTEDLILGASGFRFLCGDFNRSPDSLALFDTWRQAGWEEIQILAEQRFQRTRIPTSKKSAFSDHLWISPELAALLTDVQVIEAIFADHDPLCATFKFPKAHVHQFHWPVPAVFPWDSMPDNFDFETLPPYSSTAFSADPTRTFSKWSAKAEEQMISTLQRQGTLVPNGLRGRGQTTSVVKRPFTLVPPHAGRHGEFQCQSGLLNRAAHFWLKQLRRLQAYSQRASSASDAPARLVDQAYTWKAIVNAAGFRGGFRRWWPQRNVKLHGTMDFVPLYPPCADVAHQLLQDFKANFKQFESWQLGRRKQILQAQAHDYNKILFRQLKEKDFSPPEYFALCDDTLIAVVMGNDLVEFTDELHLPEAATWTLQGQPITLQMVSPTRAHVETDLVLAAGQRLRGVHYLTDFVNMEQALAALWRPIWQKHQHHTDEHWSRAISFAQNHMPTLEFPALTWTGEKVGALARSYKKHTATGPDGWSRLDIEKLPTIAHEQIATMYSDLQQGAAWPTQLITGFVCPVRKHLAAEQPSHYRPIILLGFLYRLWAAGASRLLLPLLAQLAGPHVYGFIPSRRAGDLWALLQCTIEMSLLDSTTLVGHNLDIIRCFNMLPRRPLMAFLEHVGAPLSILQPWSSALEQLQRRFRIADQVGPPHRSSTGFPEGDPLSCCIMVSFTLLLERYMDVFDGTSLLTSYVDNLQVISCGPGQLQQSILTLQVFLTQYDLAVDPQKSYSWGTTPAARSCLRSFGHNVRLAAKDLGAQMVYSNVKRVCTSEQRVQAIEHFWPTLKRSLAPRWFKLYAVRQAGWPKALHACENQKVHGNVTSKLRSRLCTSMGWRRAGCSPWIRIALMQSFLTDPEYYQLWTILRSFLRLLALSSHISDQWSRFVNLPQRHGQGLFRSVQAVLDLLSWRWDADLTLHTPVLSISFQHLTPAVLQLLLQDAWDDFVCRQISHRADYSDLTSIDRKLSFRPHGLSVPEQELAATIQDGTFFCSNYITKFDISDTGMCTRCLVEDNLTHRCLDCPRYAHIRASHSACIRHWSAHQPSFSLHAIVPKNEFLHPWWTSLLSLDMALDDFAFLPTPHEVYDIFTDGSCFDPRMDFARAAWSVVCPAKGRVLSSRPLWGLVQTVNRAELSAVLCAMTWKLTRPCCLRIWSDSAYVLRNFAFLIRHRSVPTTWANQDLWQIGLRLVYAIDWDNCQLLKVDAHLDEQSATTPFEDFLTHGNSMADTVAKRTNMMREATQLDLLRQFQLQHLELDRKQCSQMNFLMDIARYDTGHANMTQFDAEEITLDRLSSALSSNDCYVAGLLEPCLQMPSDWCPHFDAGVLQEFAQWICGLDISGEYQQAVSLHELVLAFSLTSTRAFPVTIMRGTQQIASFPDEDPLSALVRPTLAASAILMQSILTTLFDFVGTSPAFTKGARPTVGILKPVTLFAVGWPGEIETGVVDCFSRFVSHPVRHSRDFARPYGHLM